MKILLPIDGSECSKDTVQWAAQTFEKQATEYYLLYVIPLFYTDINIAEYQIPDATHLLNETRSLMEQQGCKVTKAEFMEGDPIRCICEYAEEMVIDLVMMGSHGRTGMKKFLMGSVSTAVMEHCKRPVSVYRNCQVQPASTSAHFMPNQTIF